MAVERFRVLVDGEPYELTVEQQDGRLVVKSDEREWDGRTCSSSAARISSR